VLAGLGRLSIGFVQATGEMVLLFARSVYWCRALGRSLRNVFRQMELIGVQTLPIASVMAFFVGLVLALQTGYQLKKFGIESILGAIVGLSFAKELGPVLTGLLLAGRVGAGIAAEVGTMKVSEEIDALTTLGINPIRYLAMPRVVAATLMMPLLICYAYVIGFFAGGLMAYAYAGVQPADYADSLFDALSARELTDGLVKGLVFGALVATVGCHQGFKTSGGAQGVGRATTRSVVISFMLILAFDYVLTRVLLWV